MPKAPAASKKLKSRARPKPSTRPSRAAAPVEASSPPEKVEPKTGRAQDALPEFVGTGTLAELLDYSPRWISKLVGEGVITKEGHGKFHLKRSVLACIAYARRLENDKAQETAGDRLKEIRRMEVERSMARDDRKIVALDESLDVLDSIMGLVVESLESIPGQIARDQDQRVKAQIVVDRIRGDLSARLDKEAAVLRTGKRAS